MPTAVRDSTALLTDQYELTMLAGVPGARRRAGPATLDWLADYRFGGDIDGYPEGELYFPGSPVLTVTGELARQAREQLVSD